MKTSELTGQALDWTVAKCAGLFDQNAIFLNGTIHKAVVLDRKQLYDMSTGEVYSPSTNWAQGGVIIEREISKLFKNVGGTYTAQIRHEVSHPLVAHKVLSGWTNCAGPTQLIAAMRCYVASNLGDEVKIPKELEK